MRKICIGRVRSISIPRSFLSYHPIVTFPARRSSTSSASSRGPCRVAVIGSGPAGFYTASRLLKSLPDVEVDMYETLPVPSGLVRYGVAPDHPEVKNVQHGFEETALSSNFNFIGNLSITPTPSSLPSSTSHPSLLAPAPSIPLSALIPYYNAINFCYGASKNRTLNIPGESTLKNIHSAGDFVGWYNGLPEFANLDIDLEAGEDCLIVGQGNVALDVARILASPIEALVKTDITESALEKLKKSRLKRIHIVGRRGWAQTSFTIKELREQFTLPTSILRIPEMSTFTPPDNLPRATKRKLDLIQQIYKQNQNVQMPSSARTEVFLRFLLSPTEFRPSSVDPSNVGSTQFAVQELDENAKNYPTGETITLPSNIVFTSIGYRSIELSNMSSLSISFDSQRGVIRNSGGRAITLENVPIPGIYVSGWVKRGPTGVIASTMTDAFETADSLVEDWLSEKEFLPGSGGWESLRPEVESKGINWVSWEGWKTIDHEEIKRGSVRGKVREKMTDMKEMLALTER